MGNELLNHVLINQVKKVSNEPGVYLWKDINGDIIYIGKSKRLKNRMLQYFEGNLNSFKTKEMIKTLYDFDVILTSSERDALILEKNLIEKHRPIYNILLLDDKRYPYIKINLSLKKLKISFCKRLAKEYGKYTYFYGPIPVGYGSKTIIKIIERELLYENGLPIVSNKNDFWINQYQKAIDIFKFKNKDFVSILKQKMFKASEDWNFELAKEYKDFLNYWEAMNEKQISEINNFKSIDVIDVFEHDAKIFFSVLNYRYGILINNDNQFVDFITTIEETVEYFILNYYKNKEKPNIILLSQNINVDYFDIPEGFSVKIPKQGLKKNLVEIAHKNNLEFIKINTKLKIEKQQKNINALSALCKILNLKTIKNIIMFDNSHFNNSFPVGVAVVYTNGFKNKEKYRKFNHDKPQYEKYKQSDDVYMYFSVLNFFKLNKNKFNQDDLVIVDGAIQQIRAAKLALKELKININVISLVKNSKHKTSKLIDLNEKARKIDDMNLFNFLSEIQFEVDRFAKYHFRKKHWNSTLEGSLSKIKGIGEKRTQLLLNKFKSYSAIYNASENELSKIVPLDIAKKIKKYVLQLSKE